MYELTKLQEENCMNVAKFYLSKGDKKMAKFWENASRGYQIKKQRLEDFYNDLIFFLKSSIEITKIDDNCSGKLKIQFNDGNDLEYDRESVSNGVCLETMVNEFFGEWVGGGSIVIIKLFEIQLLYDIIILWIQKSPCLNAISLQNIFSPQSSSLAGINRLKSEKK